MDEARGDVPAYTAILHEYWPQISSTSSIKRRTDVAGSFPNAAAIVRLVGALMLEQNDEWGRQPSLHDP